MMKLFATTAITLMLAATSASAGGSGTSISAGGSAGAAIGASAFGGMTSSWTYGGQHSSAGASSYDNSGFRGRSSSGTDSYQNSYGDAQMGSRSRGNAGSAAGTIWAGASIGWGSFQTGGGRRPD